MKQNKINTLYYFTVEGNHEFPYDMLRYDRCWPQHESDTPKMGYHPRSSNGNKIIAMVGLREPTSGRWASFGWTVIASQARDVS